MDQEAGSVITPGSAYPRESRVWLRITLFDKKTGKSSFHFSGFERDLLWHGPLSGVSRSVTTHLYDGRHSQSPVGFRQRHRRGAQGQQGSRLPAVRLLQVLGLEEGQVFWAVPAGVR